MRYDRPLTLNLLYASVRASLVVNHGASEHRISHIGPNPLAYCCSIEQTHVVIKR